MKKLPQIILNAKMSNRRKQNRTQFTKYGEENGLKCDKDSILVTITFASYYANYKLEAEKNHLKAKKCGRTTTNHFQMIIGEEKEQVNYLANY